MQLIRTLANKNKQLTQNKNEIESLLKNLLLEQEIKNSFQQQGGQPENSKKTSNYESRRSEKENQL